MVLYWSSSSKCGLTTHPGRIECGMVTDSTMSYVTHESLLGQECTIQAAFSTVFGFQ
jgi:hypothetical protein